MTNKRSDDSYRSLDVPHYHQRPDSNDCCIVCYQMVLGSLGELVEFDSLAEQLHPWFNSSQRDSQGVAINCLDRGYKVFFRHHDSSIISPEICDITQEDFDKLNEYYSEYAVADVLSDYQKHKLQLDLQIIKKGGFYSNSIPNSDYLLQCLKSQIPIITILNRKALTSDWGQTGNHYVVVRGFGEQGFLVNDPLPEHSLPYWIPKDLLVYSWYLAGCYSVAIASDAELFPQLT